MAALIRFGGSRTAARIALGALVASLGVAALMPVYTDEIVWRFHQRAWLDGGFDVWMNDACGPNTVARAPWFMLPARWFSATVNLALPAPLYVRLAGLACALLWLALLWRLAGTAICDLRRRNSARTLALALLGLGTTPYLLALSRPEQPLILAVGAMVLIALGSRRSQPLPAWAACGAIIALAVMALSYHLKGVLYAPVAMVCLVFCAKGKGTVAPRVLAEAALAALTLAAARYWSERFACPDDPVLAARFAAMNLAAAFGSGADLLAQLPARLLHATPVDYIALAAPTAQPISYWLPAGLFPAPEANGFRLAMVALWSVAGLLAAGALSSRLRAADPALARDPRVAIALTIVACLLVWGFSQTAKHMYEAAHVLPLLAVAGILLLGAAAGRDPGWRGNSGSLLATGVLAVALAGQIATAARLVPAFAGSAYQAGFVAAQPNSVALFSQAALDADIRRARTGAGIPEGAAARRLVLDEATYLALQRTTLPLLAAGVFGPWSGSRQDPVAYLLSRKSAGVVADCRSLPAELIAVAHRSGPICALGQTALETLAQR